MDFPEPTDFAEASPADRGGSDEEFDSDTAVERGEEGFAESETRANEQQQAARPSAAAVPRGSKAPKMPEPPSRVTGGKSVASSASRNVRNLGQLNRKLFLSHEQDRSRLRIAVHRAENLEVALTLPHVVVHFGGTKKRSPTNKAIGENPIFDWETEFTYEGFETHIVFEVHSGIEALGSTFIGASIVPLEAIFLAESGVFRRKLPLLRSGQAREANDRPAALFVTVTCVEISPQEGIDKDNWEKADELLHNCSQMRVTLRCMRIHGENISEDTTKMRPYVKVTTGGQSGKTMTAHKMTYTDAEEFVFIKPGETHFECGGLLGGMHHTYQGEPRRPGKGSSAMPAYRKETSYTDLQVTYRNVSFVFWHARDIALDFDVYDDIVMGADPMLASASIEIDELFKLPFMTEDRNDASSSRRPCSGLVPVPLTAVVLHPTTPGSAVVGVMEFEVEFLRDSLALPSRHESLWRNLAAFRKDLTEKHDEALRDLQEVSQAENGVFRSLAVLPTEVRTSLAVLLAAALISSRRNAVRHEEDTDDMTDRLLAGIRTLTRALDVDGDRRSALEASAMEMLPLESLAQATASYIEVCDVHQVQVLLPFAGLIAELIRIGKPEEPGAMLRCAAIVAAGAVSSHGRRFVELAERHFSHAEEDEVATDLGRGPNASGRWSEILHLGPANMNTDEWTQESLSVDAEECNATDEARREQEERLQERLASFFPSIDALVEASDQPERPVHPGDKVEAVPENALVAQWGPLAMGVIAAIMGALSSTLTGKMIEKLDDYACDFLPDVSCKVTHGKLDHIGLFLQTHPGQITFSALYGLYYGHTATGYLTERYNVIRELALDPLDSKGSRHIILCASGFLRTRGDLYSPWEIDVDNPWTCGQIVAVRWETELLLQLGSELSSFLAIAGKQAFTVIQGVISCTNPVSFSGFVLDSVMKEIANLFDFVLLRAKQAGIRLAHRLLALRLESQEVRPVSLFGFSCGSAVMTACLEELEWQATHGHPEAADIVCDVVLLGAPIPRDDKAMWGRWRRIASGSFINGFDHFDPHLTNYASRCGEAKGFAGTAPATAPGIENVALDEFIDTHSDYISRTPAILDRIYRK